MKCSSCGKEYQPGPELWQFPMCEDCLTRKDIEISSASNFERWRNANPEADVWDAWQYQQKMIDHLTASLNFHTFKIKEDEKT